MTCPKCECKLSFPYFDEDWPNFIINRDGERERCVHCGCIYYIDEALDDEDEVND